MILLGNFVYVDSARNGRVPIHSLSANDYDPELAAAAHLEKGYRAAYIPYIPIDNSELLRQTEMAFKKAGVVMAEIGYWDNLQDRDPDVRSANIRHMCEVLASADEMGVLCAVNTIGCYTFGTCNDNFNARSLSEESFETAVDICRYILKEVNPKRTKLTFENFAFTALDTIDSVEKLLKSVDDPRLGVHIDLSNFITSVREFFSYPDMAKECVRRFGDRIISAHIKDLAFARPATHVEIREVLPGTGDLDLAAYLRELQSLPKDIPCMIEHLDTESKFEQAAANIRKIACDNGICLSLQQRI